MKQCYNFLMVFLNKQQLVIVILVNLVYLIQKDKKQQ